GVGGPPRASPWRARWWSRGSTYEAPSGTRKTGGVAMSMVGFASERAAAPPSLVATPPGKIPEQPLLSTASLSLMPHPDVALERARLRFAQESLEAMRRRTAARVVDEDVLAANEADAEAVKWQLQRRLDSLNDDAGSLCFGRIDDENRDRWYIGRRHVEDAA